MELTLRLAHVWWAGLKVFGRWLVFGIVMSILVLPIEGLVYLIGSERTISMAVALLLIPIPFYLTSKYLHLLGDNESAAQRPTSAAARKAYGLRTKIFISTLVAACLSGLLLTPPDFISQLTMGIQAALFCGVPLLILSRFQFVKAASSRAQTLICVLVCLTVLLCDAGLVFGLRAYRGAHASSGPAIVAPAE